MTTIIAREATVEINGHANSIETAIALQQKLDTAITEAKKFKAKPTLPGSSEPGTLYHDSVSKAYFVVGKAIYSDDEDGRLWKLNKDGYPTHGTLAYWIREGVKLVPLFGTINENTRASA